MSDTKEALYDSRDAKLVCYLGNDSNGGIDLYEEYNKGVDKIVDAFRECAQKLEAVKTYHTREDEQLQKNNQDRNKKLADLEAKISNCRQLIQSQDQELSRFEEKIHSDCETQKATIKEEDLSIRNILQAKMAAMERQYDFEMQNMESKCNQEAQGVKQQLSDKKVKYEGEIRQLEKEISDLQRQIVVLAKDEEIQNEVRCYKENSDYKKYAWETYYNQKRQPGSVEQENIIRQQLFSKKKNSKQTVEKNAVTRLQRDGLKKELVVKASTIVRDENEIEYLSEICARNAVFGGFGNKKKDRQEQWKNVGMLIYCFPRLLLGDLENKQLNYKTLVPVSLLLILSYFYPTGVHIAFLLGLLTIILYFIFWRKKGKMKKLEIFGKSGIFKCICMTFYPYYLAIWGQIGGILIWAILSFCFCCGGDILYSWKMKKKKNKEKYQKIYETTRNNYLEKIRLTDTAVEKYKIYCLEENDNIEAQIQTQQKELDKIALFNEQEKETLAKQFETSVWNEMVEKKKAEFLEQRENQSRKNEKIRKNISEKKENIQERKSKISLVEEKLQKLKFEIICATREERHKLKVTYEQNYQAHKIELQEIEAKTQEKLKQLEQEMYEKISQKKQMISGEKEKLQNEVKNLDEFQRKKIQEDYIQKEQQIREQFGDDWDGLTDSYRQKMDDMLAKLRKNGFADISGFNYVKAWARLYPLTSCTIGYPARKTNYCKEALAGLTARATHANYKKCRIMPKNIVWGYESASVNLPPEIKKEIAGTLKEFEEFSGNDWTRDEVEYYHVTDLPSDDLYKIKCTRFEDGPCLIAYDLGNLEESIKLRDELKDFILRSFVYNSVHCIGSEEHLNCHIISMNHSADYTSFDNPFKEKLKLNILENKSDIERVLRDVREEKEIVRGKLRGSDNLFETNIKLSQEDQMTKDTYEILIVINTNYKELDNSELTYLLELSRGKGIGLYSILFVDVNEINRMENSDKKRRVESIQKLANAIGHDGRFYTLEKGKETGFCLKEDSKNGVMERIF